MLWCRRWWKRWLKFEINVGQKQDPAANRRTNRGHSGMILWVFSQKPVEERMVGQIIQNPANSLAEKISEVPKTRTITQRVLEMHVQHVVNIVEVENPKIMKEDSAEFN